MCSAGGRSVPLAIDLVLGYMLQNGQAVQGVDFTDDANIRKLMMECMRYHAPVTVLPYWIKDGDSWKHELICLDRACSDPDVFPAPDEFKLRENSEASEMSWGYPALVDDDVAHPDSHACPGKELSISMVTAFIQEYQALGPWTNEKK